MSDAFKAAGGESDRPHLFHQSLRAAVVAGARLDLGEVPASAESVPAPEDRTLGGTATLAKLDRLEPLLSEWVQSHPLAPERFDPSGQQTADSASKDSASAGVASAGVSSIGGVVPGLPTGYWSAYVGYAESERMDLVLDALTVRRAVTQDLAGTVRPVWFYLAAMTVVATAGIAIFSEFSLPRLAAIRADLTLLPSVEQTPSWLAIPRLGWLLVTLPLLVLALILLGLSARGSAAIANLLGGRRYRDAREVVTRARIEQAIWRRRDDRIEDDHEREAPRSKNEKQSVTRVRRVGWSLVANSAASLAAHRLMRLRISLPMLLIAVLGGGGVLLYGLVLFGPLVMLIHDLATISTETGMWP
ncbi:hypothetical protein [Allorhodopirellula solitaria]|uniref:Uncharacterized protein n=1 Tax=Allorhodopirellula solitaria TaxID=2527987 RepID=A0A5C5YKL4_9BACT|nr:hypothetical protein [Allorhodopirellula solitaria]TWT75412.1 hypothetical protein CA85_07030 [Allorhodopirellula solitaria]